MLVLMRLMSYPLILLLPARVSRAILYWVVRHYWMAKAARR